MNTAHPIVKCISVHVVGLTYILYTSWILPKLNCALVYFTYCSPKRNYCPLLLSQSHFRWGLCTVHDYYLHFLPHIHIWSYWVCLKSNHFGFVSHRINALVEEQVKKRLFEEQMAREKAHRLKLEMDARDRAKQLQQIQLAHTKEMEQLRKKFAESRSVYSWHFFTSDRCE